MRMLRVVVVLGLWACSDSSSTRKDAGNGSIEDDASVDAAEFVHDTMPDTPAATEPEIVSTGTAGLLLRGTIVLPAGPITGEVLVEGNLITCAAASCASSSGAATATVVDTHGFVYPGLIDTYNLALFSMFDGTDWPLAQFYGNSNQWTANTRYGQVLDAKQYIGGEASSPVDLRCEMDKHSELRALLAGTTTLHSMNMPASLACYGVLARTLDVESSLRQSTSVPDNTAAISICNGFTANTIDRLLVRVAEGTDATALNEFTTLQSRNGGCLINAKTTILRGTALEDAQLTVMANAGMSLVWSPGSDAKFYGTSTGAPAEIPLARQKGINIALGTMGSFFGASANLFQEMRAAEQIDASHYGNVLTPKMLFEMATINAAKAVGRDSLYGSIAVGKRADLMVLRPLAADAYDALVAASPKDVQLVLVDGVALTGHTALAALGPAAPGCETIDVCGRQTFMCAATTTATNKMNQTVAQIETALTDAMTAYDAMVDSMAITAFSPIAPLAACP